MWSRRLLAIAWLGGIGCVTEPPRLPPPGLGEPGNGSDLGDTELGSSDEGGASVTSAPDGETQSVADEGGSSSTSAGELQCDGAGGLGEACDPVADDCPPCFKCAPWAEDGGSAWNAANCRPVDPEAVGPGDSCRVEGSPVSGIDDCDEDSMCWVTEAGANEGTCLAFCRDGPDGPTCDGPGFVCHIGNGGVLPLCRPTCNPLLQDCPAGYGCYAGADSPAPLCFQDASGEAGELADPCTFLNACDPGLSCQSPGDSVAGCTTEGCCTPFCDVLAPACPAAAPQCVPWWDLHDVSPPAGLEDLGICTQ